MLSYIALMVYLLALVHSVLSFFFDNKYFKALCNIFVVSGFIINIYEVVQRWVETGRFPSATLYDFMILLSAAFAATYIVVNMKLKNNVLGLFILPCPVVFSALAIFSPVYAPPGFVESVWRYGHLPFIILGTTFFIVSFLFAVMFFIQEKQLRGKKFGVIFRRFPSLDILNKMNDTTLKIGFYFFSIGALLGFVWMLEGGFGNIMSSPKVIFSLITWLIFTFIIVRKAKKNTSPRATALLTIIGFLSVMVTYIGVAVFLIR